ncbi:hypothetical protein AAULR_10865, partial [Lacticaseibacillus rhamnosus MTCC 5462]
MVEMVISYLVGLLLGTGIWFTKTALMPVKINS